MKTAVIALTKNGSKMALKIGKEINGDIYLKREFITRNEIKVFDINEMFSKVVEEIFKTYDALIFIMAAGIVVRTIAPFIISKRSDPAVIVMDEKGENVISLLSGHIGGGNELTRKIAGILGANPVITTATDVNNVLAFDVFAKENDMEIENFENLKFVSWNLVNGEKVWLYSDLEIEGEIPSYISVTNDLDNKELNPLVALSNRSDLHLEIKNSLVLRPKNLILGIGCKKGTKKEDIHNAVKDFLSLNKKSILSVKCVATIDIKMKEPGIIEFCKENNLELKEVLRDDIKEVERFYETSDFVRENIGIGCVAEPCSMLAGENPRLLRGKEIYSGITLALSEEPLKIVIENNLWKIENVRCEEEI